MKDRSTVLYEDDCLKLTEDRVHIKWYYFPVGTSKVFSYSEITAFEVRPVSELDFTETKTWGMALAPIWWPLDIARLWKEAALIFNLGVWCKAGVTPQNPSEAARIVRQRMKVANEGELLQTAKPADAPEMSAKTSS